MTSQRYGVHHFPLSPPDLVAHMDERDSCFRLDPDDPVFLKSFTVFVLLFSHHFQLRTNFLESSTKAVNSCFAFYFCVKTLNGGLYLKLKIHVRRVRFY